MLFLKNNPKYVLRNHLGEQAIRAAKLKDFSGVQNLLTVLETPFDEHPEFESFAAFPPDWAAGIEISCSS
jgi:serine/tyrosine/threonine adenylyltransferase